MFIMVDGIDGSGKSTVIEAWKQHLAGQGETIFDLKEYWKQRGAYPEYAELQSYDFIFSGEPTYAGIGKVIREELIKRDTNYPPLAIAEAYSLDRLVLYKKIIIPALAEGKIVVQDRGVSTSLCYQPLTHSELTTDLTSQLPGNALALEYRPDNLVLLTIDAATALARLDSRHDKQDNVIFEQQNFQQQAAERFASPEYQKLFTDRGTQIHYLQAQQLPDTMKGEAVTLLTKLLGTQHNFKS